MLREGDPSSQESKELAVYTQALEMAAETYNIAIPGRPMFVRWGSTAAETMETFNGYTWDFCQESILLCFAFVFFSALILHASGVRLTGDPPSDNWHPEKLEDMAYGVKSKRSFSQELTRDLLNGRTYWTGEVIPDFTFYLCNTHTYLACLFSHPVHVVSKLQRLCIAVTVSLFATVPIAALSPTLGAGGVLHFLVAAVFATVPRRLHDMLLTYLAPKPKVMAYLPDTREWLPCKVVKLLPASKAIVMWEDGKETTCDIWAIRQDFKAPATRFPVQLKAVAGIAAATAVMTVILSCMMQFDLGSNLDRLGFAFVLEPLIDLVMPYVGRQSPVTFGLDRNAVAGEWALGFFGRWLAERRASKVWRSLRKNQATQEESTVTEEMKRTEKLKTAAWAPAHLEALGL